MHTLFRKIEKIGTVVALALGIGQNGMGTAAGFNCETQRNASKRSAGAPALFGSAVAYTLQWAAGLLCHTKYELDFVFIGIKTNAIRYIQFVKPTVCQAYQ